MPSNGQTNYSGGTIQLEFNEPIQLKDAKEEVLITPTFGKETKFLFKKNTVTIIPSEELSKDITYSISFRQSIQDLNEGNPAEDLTLAFSTGRYIDSLNMYGKVTTAAEAKPAEKYTVAIYQADTFNIFKHTPVYITRTAKNGTFSIQNLKPGTYHAYAFADKNKNLKVDTQSEWFGTAPVPINLPTDKDSIRIPVFKIDIRPLKMNSSRGVSNYSVIRLNKAPASYRLASIQPGDHVISHYGSNRSEITAYPPKSWPDSTAVRLTAIDSVGQAIDTTFFIKQTKQKPLKEAFKLAAKTPVLTTSTKRLHAEIGLTLPISSVRTDSIKILHDSIPIGTIKPQSITYDSTSLKITIDQEFTLPDSLTERKIILSLGKGWVHSIFQDTIATNLQRVSVKTQKTAGTIEVKATTRHKNILLQAINEKYEIIETQEIGKVNTFGNLDPAGTIIRAVEDNNNNGLWDYGNPLNKTQPERVWIYAGKDGKRQVPLRANWVVDIEWKIE